MTYSVRIAPVIQSRPCSFCLSLQDDSVFADFNVDEEGHVTLCRISFDGFGCCSGNFRKMSARDSLLLAEAVERDSVETPQIETALRDYFESSANVIWRDALAAHALI
jgi:hypothetical protein